MKVVRGNVEVVRADDSGTDDLADVPVDEDDDDEGDDLLDAPSLPGPDP